MSFIRDRLSIYYASVNSSFWSTIFTFWSHPYIVRSYPLSYYTHVVAVDSVVNFKLLTRHLELLSCVETHLLL